MEFPRLVYLSASKTLGVNNEMERREALKAGWFDSVPEALAGKSNTPLPAAAPVVIFKKAGTKVQEHTAKDQAEADALMAGDGWHATKAAAIAAAWPAADTVPGVMEDLGKQSPEAIVEYAHGLGMTTSAKEKPAALLARIETTLLTGAGK